MDLKSFFEQFELLTDAPNGVQKLRELILQLAVQGKLVPQDPNDEPASVLLEKIKAEKERLVKEGKIRKSQIISPPELVAVLYQLPKSWSWTRLGTICTKLVDGSHNPPKKLISGIPMISSQNVLNNQITLDASRYITEEDYQKEIERTNIQPGDVFLTIVGTIGRSAVVPKNLPYFATQRSIAVIQSKIFPYYLSLYLRSSIAHEYYLINSKGTAQLGIYLNKLSLLYVPIPPFNEQKRIVEKVDRLMELCDELEARKQQKQHHVLQLGEIATSQLLTTKTPETFNHHWQCICDKFDLIYSTPENVKQLRQAILQLAVMGKLVPQDSNDEPASVLLEKIKTEKDKLINEGKIKKEKEVSAIDLNEIPYDLPKEWKWIRLGECIELISGQHLSKDEQNENSEGLPYLTGPSDFGNVYPIATRWTLTPKAIAKKNDILITVKGAGVGKTNILGLAETAIGRQLMAIRPFFLKINYIYLLILASFDKFQDLSIGCTVPGIGREDIFNFLTPLPPLAEQKRILAKVDQLMSMCDRLETQLTQTISDREKLMEIAVSQILAA